MRARRVDANHAQLSEAFRALGCAVLDLSQLGRGVPDLLVGVPGRCPSVWVLVEVKDGSKSPSDRKLTEAEAGVRRMCLADRLPWELAESFNDVKRIVDAYRR
jgi:hypothetical protein